MAKQSRAKGKSARKRLKHCTGSGLLDAANRLRGLDGVYIHEFECSDIVRSGLVKTIMSRYEQTGDSQPGSLRY